MMRIDLTPEALHDLEVLKDYLDDQFGTDKGKIILEGVFADLGTPGEYPDSGSKDIFGKYEIETDYMYLVTHKNYAFYRVEGNCVKIIRILDTRRDVIYTLFGIKTVEDYSAYWDE